MKKITFFLSMLPLALSGQCPTQGNGTLDAVVTGNMVVLWNNYALRNCASWYVMEITQPAPDTLVWLQEEQGGGVYCMCHFDFSVTVDSLEAGDYYVKAYYTNFPYPYGDTCFIGSVSFTITEPNSLAGFVITDDWQSECLNVGMGETDDGTGIDLTVVPNPAGDEVTILFPERLMNAHLTIYSANGVKFLEKQARGEIARLDISTLPPGVYFMRLQDERFVETVKMIKQ